MRAEKRKGSSLTHGGRAPFPKNPGKSEGKGKEVPRRGGSPQTPGIEEAPAKKCHPKLFAVIKSRRLHSERVASETTLLRERVGRQSEPGGSVTKVPEKGHGAEGRV